MGVIVIPVPSSGSCDSCKSTPLSLGLGLGLGLGIPLLFIIVIWLCCRYHKYSMNKLSHKLMISFNKKYNRLVEIVPDQQMRTNIDRCIFHPNVIEYVGHLKEEEQDFIYKYIKDKHHESKSQELITLVNIQKENSKMNHKAIIEIVCEK